MDFPNRNETPQAAPTATTAVPGSSGGAKKNKTVNNEKWMRVGVIGAVIAVVILLIAVIASVSVGGAKPEEKFVDNTKLQAVFLNTGQVYFGKIKELNSKYFVVQNIYYLQTAGGGAAGSAANANTSVSLVKLGCELHQPNDQMVINRAQVTFWENLGDNGQVAQAVKTFVKQNPSGQKCADQSTSSGNTSNSAQNAGSNAGSNGGNSTGRTTPTAPTTTTPSTPTNVKP